MLSSGSWAQFTAHGSTDSRFGDVGGACGRGDLLHGSQGAEKARKGPGVTFNYVPSGLLLPTKTVS